MDYLQDAEENLEDVSITIYASSDQEAQLKAERYAASLCDAETIAVCLGCRRITKKTGRYACIIRIEVKPVLNIQPENAQPEGD